MGKVFNIVVFTASILTPALSLAAPQNTQAASLLSEGQEALNAGKYAEAMRQGSAFSAKFPKRFEGHRLVARAAFALDQPDRAEREFCASLQWAPVAAKPSLQAGLREVALLRKALPLVAKAKALRASDDLVGAAKKETAAFRTLPSRYAWGLSASEFYQSAGEYDEARKLLEEVRLRNPSSNAITLVPQRLASLQTHLVAARKREAQELARKQEEERRSSDDRKIDEQRRAVDEERRAKEDARQEKIREQKRADAKREAERQAEEERQKAEKARQDREETERLTRVLNDQRTEVSSAETAVKNADAAVDDFQSAVQRVESELDDAREVRNRTKRERDRLQDKLNDAKTEMEKNVVRLDLRSAESAYDDAQGKADRLDRKRDDAKSRLTQAQQDASTARQRLDQARQNLRGTEDALARIVSGA